MPFAYYNRLSPARQAVYRRSDEIGAVDLPAGVPVAAPVAAIGALLPAGDRTGLQRATQALVDALVEGFAVPPVDLRVLAVRPSDLDGELHGLYEPDEDRAVARITVWMRTAQKKQVVAFRSYVRTVVHEFLHHLDYEHFELPETFHTEGFYRRESSLANALFAHVGAPDRAAGPPIG